MLKVTFLQNTERELCGIMYISAVLKQHGHDCNVLIENEVDIVQALKEIKPNIVAFSCMTSQYVWMIRMAERVKAIRPDVMVVVGGPHPTSCPDIIVNPFIDIICRGEGEYAMLELVNRIENGGEITDIRGMWIKSEGYVFRNQLRQPVDINALPFPDRRIYHNYSFNDSLAVFIVNRGCVCNCAYCSIPIVSTDIYKDERMSVPRMRVREIENVISEIKSTLEYYEHEKRNKKYIMFLDSIFIFNKRWSLSFLKRYREEIAMPFFCTTEATMIDNEIVSELKESNCQCVSFGIETGNERLRKDILNKKVTNECIERAAIILRKHELKFRTNNIYCLPGETLANALETISINQKIKPDYTSNFIYLPLPGTRLMEYAVREGYVEEGYLEQHFSSPFKSVIRQRDNRKIESFSRVAGIVIKYPALFPFIKFLLRFPVDSFIYRFYLSYIYVLLDSKRAQGSSLRNKIVSLVMMIEVTFTPHRIRDYFKRFGYYLTMSTK